MQVGVHVHIALAEVALQGRGGGGALLCCGHSDPKNLRIKKMMPLGRGKEAGRINYLKHSPLRMTLFCCVNPDSPNLCSVV